MLKAGSQRTREGPSAANTNLFIPASAHQERLRAWMSKTLEVYRASLAGQPMTQQDWTIWEVRRTEAFRRSVTNGLVRHLNGLISECSCCVN